MKCSPLLASALLGLLVHGAVPAQDKGGVRFEKNLTYAKAAGQELQLDLAMPKEGTGPFPCVVCLHGGGWRSGKRQDLTKLTELLAGKGFVAATVTYRLAPDHHFPAQIEDCKAAVRWLRANAAKYHINPQKIGAVGFSAGGHLASLLGTADTDAGLEGKGGNLDQSSRVQAVVNYFGPTDFTTKTWSAHVKDAFIIPFLVDPLKKQNMREVYEMASPVTHVSKDDPPFLFFHGDKDGLVGLEQPQILSKKLQEAGVSAKVVVLEGEGHGWGGETLNRTLRQSVEFFEEKLKK
jgi:acetyl esterase/lipase